MKFKRISHLIKRPSFAVTALRNRISPISAEEPRHRDYSYSDLFIWRSDKQLNTKYQFTPYSDLIKPILRYSKESQRRSRIVLLSREGILINEEIISALPFRKKSILINSLILDKSWNEDYGSFLIFHEDLPSHEELGEGYLTDRGYTNYGSKQLSIASYAHGNLDAVSGKFGYKGTKGLTYTRQTIINRVYDIQYQFNNKNNYELAFVNPSFKRIKLQVLILSLDRSIIEKKEFKINSLGTYILDLSGLDELYYISIISKLPMSRPSIFKYINNILIDVFHG